MLVIRVGIATPITIIHSSVTRPGETIPPEPTMLSLDIGLDITIQPGVTISELDLEQDMVLGQVSQVILISLQDIMPDIITLLVQIIFLLVYKQGIIIRMD